MYADAHAPAPPPGWLVVVDVAAKVLLLVAIARISVDPAWGNLEGKAPGARALTYPMLALVVPVWHVLARSGHPYPWGADLLVTLPGFSDILGNRLDLYDRLTFFDDVIHLAATGALAAGVVLLADAAHAPVLRRLEVAVAAGMTMALAWEVWEYAAFVTRSREVATAYADTGGDLAMGWTGAVAAALLVGLAHPRQRRSPRSGTWGLHVELVSEGGLEPPRPNTGTSTSS